MSRLFAPRALALLLAAAALLAGAAACSASAAGHRPAEAAPHCPGVDAEAVRCRDD